VKNKKRNQEIEYTAIEAAVQETAKYSVKDADYLSGNLENDLEVVKDLEEGLYRKRMVAYGGLLKEIHKQLNLDDVEEGDLIRVDDESEEDEKAYSVVAHWNWAMKNYYIY
ncbi:protein rep, partial [Kurthia sibirica]